MIGRMVDVGFDMRARFIIESWKKETEWDPLSSFSVHVVPLRLTLHLSVSSYCAGHAVSFLHPLLRSGPVLMPGLICAAAYLASVTACPIWALSGGQELYTSELGSTQWLFLLQRCNNGLLSCYLMGQFFSVSSCWSFSLILSVNIKASQGPPK